MFTCRIDGEDRIDLDPAYQEDRHHRTYGVAVELLPFRRFDEGRSGNRCRDGKHHDADTTLGEYQQQEEGDYIQTRFDIRYMFFKQQVLTADKTGHQAISIVRRVVIMRPGVNHLEALVAPMDVMFLKRDELPPTETFYITDIETGKDAEDDK